MISDSLIRCTSDQFDKGYIPPERRYVMDQFNRLAESIESMSSRLEALEKKVDDMHRTLFPEVEDTKPGLSRSRLPKPGEGA